MARDYTKYTVEGLGENLNKRKLVFTIVKDYIEKNKPSFEDLQQVFPDDVQGSKGFIRKESDVKTPKHFNMREPIKIKNGAHVVVSNQWGENINDFIAASEKLGYVTIANSAQIKTDFNENEVINSVRVLIRNMENSEDVNNCSYFDLPVSTLSLEFITPITTEYLTTISNTIFNDSKHVDDIKRITSKYTLNYDWVPQLWITKINDVDISIAHKYFFEDDDTAKEELSNIFKLNEYDLDNFFESDGVHSLEGL